MLAEYLLLAKSSAIDLTTNTLSIFEIIDDVDVTVPKQQLQAANTLGIEFQVISSILREAADPQGIFASEIGLKMTSDNPEKIDWLPIRYEAHHVRFRLRVNVNFQFTKAGSYSIAIVTKEGKVIAEKKIKIQILQGA